MKQVKFTWKGLAEKCFLSELLFFHIILVQSKPFMFDQYGPCRNLRLSQLFSQHSLLHPGCSVLCSVWGGSVPEWISLSEPAGPTVPPGHPEAWEVWRTKELPDFHIHRPWPLHQHGRGAWGELHWHSLLRLRGRVRSCPLQAGEVQWSRELIENWLL